MLHLSRIRDCNYLSKRAVPSLGGVYFIFYAINPLQSRISNNENSSISMKMILAQDNNQMKYRELGARNIDNFQIFLNALHRYIAANRRFQP